MATIVPSSNVPGPSRDAGGLIRTSQLLIIIIDASPAQKYVRDEPAALYKVVDALVAFGNAHVLLNSANEVAFYASTITDSHMLYPIEKRPDDTTQSIHQVDGQYEQFLAVEILIRNNMKVMTKDPGFIPQRILDEEGLSTCLASALLKALSFINLKEKKLGPNERLNSRILIVSGSCESTAQYMAFNNAFFAAQKQGIVIDACVLGPYATLLNQGADITGGIYFKPPGGHTGLLQHLLWVFLPDAAMRKELTLPSAEPVDYRAACFCHRQLISEGFVCSVCLSIFCRFTPICTTCNSTFKLPMALPAGKKRLPPPPLPHHQTNGTSSKIMKTNSSFT